MPIKIIADSSCDMTVDLKKKYPIELVPFKLYLGSEETIDDESLDPLAFIQKMMQFSGVPRTACPSPNDFKNALDPKSDCYIITLSASLSGTYNSAILAKNELEEENPDQFVHVFDSKSASIGETLIGMKLYDLYQTGLQRNELIDQVNAYISEMKLFFIAESLDHLIKNGRISKFKGLIATALNIKPIMGADSEGNIALIEKARGSNKAFQRMVEMIVETAKNAEGKVIAISHANNPERAQWLKEEIQKSCQFKEVIIVQTAGLSSLYLDNQGIIVAF